MLNNLKTYLREGLRFQSLEIYSNNEEKQYSWILVKKSKGQLIIEDQKLIGDFDLLSSFLKTNLPLCLSFNLKQVITKKITNSVSQTEEAIVNHVFPNIDLDSVFFDTYILGNTKYLSVIKKELILDFLDKIKILKVQPVSITIGHKSLTLLLPFFLETRIVLNASTLVQPSEDKGEVTIENRLVNDYPNVYNINNMRLQSEFLTAFGSVLAFISKQKSTSSNLLKLETSLSKDFINRRQVGLLVRGTLITLLAALLINFLLFSSYYDNVSELSEQQSLNQTNKHIYENLLKSVTEKEEQLQLIKSTANSKVSFYLDEFSENVPHTITLERLTFQPLKTLVRENKAIELNDKLLYVSGVTTDPLSFSTWVQNMEQFPWIESIEAMDFDYTNKTSTHFGLSIFLKNEL